MFPLRDDQPRYSVPFITYFLIAINLLIFVFEWSLTPSSLERLVFQFGLVPSHFVATITGHTHQGIVAGLVPLLTSMFLHGSPMHVLGNMWFLWIFGDNIEDFLGHSKYLVFYLISGVIAALAQVALLPHSRVPTVGASGAIAGVLAHISSCIRGRASIAGSRRSSSSTYPPGSCSATGLSFSS